MLTFGNLTQVVFLYKAHYSTGAVAAGFTSTVLTPETKHEAAIVEEDLIRYERVKKKGMYC
jgi:peptidyl-prolyl cis-trans isomerase-like protein 2